MHQQQHQQPQQQHPQHPQHPQQQQHDEQHTHCHAYAYSDHSQLQAKQSASLQSTSTPHRQLQHRKHSHSPHHSRHTSPHSHHSHSLHSSPHQSHHHMHERLDNETDSLSHPQTARPSTQSSTSHATHHHHHRRKRKHHNHHHHHTSGGAGSSGGGGGGSGNSSSHGTHGHSHMQQHSKHQGHHNCSRRHRSATDISSTSINTCHDQSCIDREVQEIFVHKTCCNSSRTELAQYFAEDLYGTSRRPSSCCTSSDYCYQTDSTSLYGSRSSLSRNNSVKSASMAMRKRRMHQRQPSYTSISLRGLNASRPNSQLGSLTSMFDRAKQVNAPDGDELNSKVIVSPSKVTIERQTSKDALSNDLPEYACSPSPIRWSFLADGKSPTEFDGASGAESKDIWKIEAHEHEQKYPHEHGQHERQRYESKHQHRSWKHSDDRPSTSTGIRKCKDGPFSCDFEESTTVLFHQEAEAYNNCCSNYVQCNTYLDQDLQITSEDIHQYLSKGNQIPGDILNNSKNYPFQPSNALEFQYKNNFANNNNGTMSSEGGDSTRTFDDRFRRNSSKETNLNQNTSCAESAVNGTCANSTCSNNTPLSPTNINLSSSTNNINIVFGTSSTTCMEQNANEVKFINTARENAMLAEVQHSGYLPYAYPSYDYTNMSTNSVFDKPIGIDELPKEFGGSTEAAAATGSSSTTASDEHSSDLQSPAPMGASFESFDAPSDHNLLSHRGSCQFSPPIRSPLSPGSPAASSMSSINPAAASYVHHTHHTHHYHNQYHHHHFTENSKIGNAFKRVRKRARKYTDFLRKK